LTVSPQEDASSEKFLERPFEDGILLLLVELADLGDLRRIVGDTRRPIDRDLDAAACLDTPGRCATSAGTHRRQTSSG
jgi:hypothetical protein